MSLVKIARLLILVLGCALIATACSKSPGSMLVGKWQRSLKGAGDSCPAFISGLEFTNEGRVIAYYHSMGDIGEPRVGTFKVEGDRLFIEDEMYTAAVTGGTLTLVKPAQSPCMFNKVNFDPVNYAEQPQDKVAKDNAVVGECCEQAKMLRQQLAELMERVSLRERERDTLKNQLAIIDREKKDLEKRLQGGGMKAP